MKLVFLTVALFFHSSLALAVVRTASKSEIRLLCEAAEEYFLDQQAGLEVDWDRCLSTRVVAKMSDVGIRLLGRVPSVGGGKVSQINCGLVYNGSPQLEGIVNGPSHGVLCQKDSKN